jgi:hypothetical protein
MAATNPKPKKSRVKVISKASDEESQLEKKFLNSPKGKKFQEQCKAELKVLKKIGDGGDITEIVAVEKRLLDSDLDKDPETKSLWTTDQKKGIEQMSYVEEHADLVKDSDAYKKIDKAFSRPIDRSKNLPTDGVRKALREHRVFLSNRTLGQMYEVQKKLLEQRVKNIKIAEGNYISLQRKALGLDKW